MKIWMISNNIEITDQILLQLQLGMEIAVYWTISGAKITSTRNFRLELNCAWTNPSKNRLRKVRNWYKMRTATVQPILDHGR
jgi:hypothetical protein